MMRAMSQIVCCLAAVTIITGCSRHDGLKRTQIIGLLTIQGQPLGNASVELTPVKGSETPGQGALGVADSNGKFAVISSRRGHGGLPPGEYNVRVSLFAAPDGTPLPPEATQADNPFAYEAIPVPYCGTGSPLRILIPEEGGEVKIDIPAKLIGPKKKKA